VRVLGSALFTTTEALIAWRLLAAIEMPLMLVSVMKYITRMFDVKISATAYMLGFGVAKSLGVALFSTTFGLSYEAIGYSSTYLVMTGAIVVLTVVASLFMRNDLGRLAPGEDVAAGIEGPDGLDGTSAEAPVDIVDAVPAAGDAVATEPARVPVR